MYTHSCTLDLLIINLHNHVHISLIILANTQTPDLALYHVEFTLTVIHLRCLSIGEGKPMQYITIKIDIL